MNGKRKFIVTVFALVAASVLCYFRCISGAEFVTCVTLTLAMYKTANVVDKKLGGAG